MVKTQYLQLKAELLVNGINATSEALKELDRNIKNRITDYSDGTSKITATLLCQTILSFRMIRLSNLEETAIPDI